MLRSAKDGMTRVNLGRPCRQRQGWRGEGRGDRDQEEQLWEWVVGISSQPLEGMVKWLFGILLGKRV